MSSRGDPPLGRLVAFALEYIAGSRGVTSGRGLQQALRSVSRREFGVGAAALMAATSVGTGCGRAAAGYEESIRRIWAPLRAEEGMRELVRAGTLAANSHNTQPWRFKVSERSIAVLPDLSRRTAVVDPDNHHVFCSLGCATENIVQAAGVFGHSATAEFDDARGQVVIALTPTSVPASPLSAAIVERQCTRAEYDGRVLPKEKIAALQAAGSTDGVTCTIIEDRRRLESVLEAITEANSAQMGDKAFVAELVTWLRFNDAHALDTLDGLFTRTSGNPPPWLGRRVISLFMTERARTIATRGSALIFRNCRVLVHGAQERLGRRRACLPAVRAASHAVWCPARVCQSAGRGRSPASQVRCSARARCPAPRSGHPLRLWTRAPASTAPTCGGRDRICVSSDA